MIFGFSDFRKSAKSENQDIEKLDDPKLRSFEDIGGYFDFFEQKSVAVFSAVAINVSGHKRTGGIKRYITCFIVDFQDFRYRKICDFRKSGILII